MSDSQLLAPWEYVGNIPQVDQAGELVWKGRTFRFELLFIEQFKELGVRDFHISSPEDDGSWNVVLSDSRLPIQDIIEHGFPEAAERGWIRREFYIDSEVLCIRPDGEGYWHQSHEVMSSFHLGHPAIGLTSSQTYEMVLDLLTKPSSDIAYALRFKRMEREEKLRCIFGADTEGELARVRAELGLLCRLVLHSDASIETPGSRSRWSLKATNGEQEARFYSRQWPDNELDTARLNAWAKVLERFGSVRLNLDHLCAREEFHIHRSSSIVNGDFTIPSAHERLEARLALLDWAQQNLPPDVWAELKQFED